jgi:hypothetical protein
VIPLVDQYLGRGMRQCAYSPFNEEICSGEVHKLKVDKKQGGISLQSNPSYSYGYMLVPSETVRVSGSKWGGLAVL